MAKVYFPTGTYLITSSLLVQRLNSLDQYQAVCVEMYGDHRAFPVGNSDLYNRASYIVQLSNIVPALAVQCARGVVVRNLGFIGQNIFPANFTTDSLLDDTVFVNNHCRDEKNSPYVGFAIDYATDTRPQYLVTGVQKSGPENGGNPTLTITRDSANWTNYLSNDGYAVTKVEFYVRNGPGSSYTYNVDAFAIDGEQY